MEQSPESDKVVEWSDRIILECSCGERRILLGLEKDWLAEERTAFRCRCGEILSLADRVDEDVLEFRRLMRDAFEVLNG
jgi:hypothetical protein